VKVLVTGSSGRLGPYVVKELEQAGHDLVLFSRRPPAPELGHLAWVEGDIRVFEDCLQAAKGGFDAIQHLAAQPWPTDHPGERQMAEQRGVPFDTTMQSNVMGTYYLLQAALAEGIEIFVMTGSNCALGHGYRISDAPFPFRYLPVDEEHPSDVEDSYSFSKLVGEMLLESYTRAYGMRTYAVRAAGICNAERRLQMAQNVKPVQGWNPWLWAWVGSEDVASAHRLLMEKAHGIAPHGAFFCNADDTTALEPSRELIARFRPDLLPLVRDLDGHATFLSNQKLRQTVGWEHRTSWR
jgi:nucleoside-diphosphate-sugar epimerase